MAWFDAYGEANKAVDEYAVRNASLVLFGGATPRVYGRADTETQYRYTSMTYAAAEAGCKQLIAAASAIPGLKRTAKVRKQNEAGAYSIEVVDILEGTWVQQ